MRASEARRIVVVESAKFGRPVVGGAVIPRPFGSGQVYVRPATKASVYGRPLDTTQEDCRLGDPAPKQPIGSQTR